MPQVIDWYLLQPTSLDPEVFGWIKKKDIYSPVATVGPIAPEQLRKFISCGCQTGCKNNMCSCVKNNLKCVSACSGCNGLSCENCEQVGPAMFDDDDDIMFEEWLWFMMIQCLKSDSDLRLMSLKFDKFKVFTSLQYLLTNSE